MKARFAVLMFVTALLMGAFASTGAATPPQPVTFSDQIGDGFVGTWSATGVVNDSGSLVEPSVRFVGNGEIHVVREMTGSSGTITMRFQSKVTSVVGDVVTFEGQWVIVSGTGLYANLHGQGERTATLAGGVITETLTGQAHFD
jgi:hypothetical protein